MDEVELRLTDRQVEALERIADALEAKAPECTDKPADSDGWCEETVEAFIRSREPVPRDGWRIPPDLPERGAEPLSEMVQVTLANGAVTTAQYHHGRDEWLAIGNGHRQSVLAWQPLPPAYVPPVPEPAAMTAEEKLGAIVIAWYCEETGAAVLEAIKKVLDAPLASPWRPIETAPIGQEIQFNVAGHSSPTLAIWGSASSLLSLQRNGYTHWASIPPLPGKETR